MIGAECGKQAGQGMTDIRSSQAEIAKMALEQVCSGARLGSIRQHYSAGFIDHVNGVEYRGHEGIRKSVAAYRKFLADLRIEVKDQLVDADRVICRFTVTGRCHGRAVSFDGITISRFEEGIIVEDWSVTDTLGMLKQLGLWRCLLVVLRR